MLLLCFALILNAPQAVAQVPLCAPRNDILAAASSRFGEVPQAHGRAKGQVVEKLWAPDRSFTVLLTGEDKSCVLVSGRNWQDFPFIPGDPA